jgi:hypothetical protein
MELEVGWVIPVQILNDWCKKYYMVAGFICDKRVAYLNEGFFKVNDSEVAFPLEGFIEFYVKELKKIASEKYPIGTRYNSFNAGGCHYLTGVLSKHKPFCTDLGVEVGLGYVYIFNQGVWAEVVKDVPKKLKAEELVPGKWYTSSEWGEEDSRAQFLRIDSVGDFYYTTCYSKEKGIRTSIGSMDWWRGCEYYTEVDPPTTETLHPASVAIRSWAESELEKVDTALLNRQAVNDILLSTNSTARFKDEIIKLARDEESLTPQIKLDEVEIFIKKPSSVKK